MYEKPQVQKFGTFRELTRTGFQGMTDGLTFGGVTGGNCNDGLPVSNGATTMTCVLRSPGSGQR